MKQSTKENLSITALGIGSAVLFVAAGTALAIYVSDWQKWYGLVFWTAFTFGFAAYWYGRGLWKPRCLAVFSALLVIHVTVLLRYLGTADGFPDIFFLFFSPLEATLVAVALMLVGGIPPRRARRPGRRRPRLKRDAPEGADGSELSDAKEGGRRG